MIPWSSTLDYWRVSRSTTADREPARNDAEAKRRLLGVLNRSLSAVCNEAIWLVSPGGDGVFTALTAPPIVPLRVDEEKLWLRSTLQFSYVDDLRFGGRERKASTHFYAHTVGETDRLKPQLYSWEWASSEPTYPHLHLRRADPAFHGLGKLHIPTGRVFYEDVLRFLIAEHGVEPAREDWQKALDDSFRRVSNYASWGGGRSS